MSEEVIDIPKTFGALLIGGIIAASFTGVVTSQVYSYYKVFPADRPFIKLLVFAVWFLDLGHTGFIVSSLWHHFITAFGNPLDINSIPWSLAMTVAFTAILTLLVHCFFIHRIHKLSLDNWFISVPLGTLAFLRLAFACLTTIQMIKLRSLPLFVEKFRWSFTMGLMISCLIDVLLTAFLCWLLMRSQKQTSSLNHILDKLMLYAFENGSLTTAATCVSLLCWLIMPTNLIFMGLHFVISKFYANSLLATLNRRKKLQEPQVYTAGNQSNSTPSQRAAPRSPSRAYAAKWKDNDQFTPVVLRRLSRGTDATLSPSQSTFFDLKSPTTTATSKLGADPDLEADLQVYGNTKSCSKHKAAKSASPTTSISIRVNRSVAVESDCQPIDIEAKMLEYNKDGKDGDAGEAV